MRPIHNRIVPVLAVLLGGLLVSSAQAALVGVDFGSASTPQTTPPNWNFMPTNGLGNPVTKTNLIDDTGAATGLSISVESLNDSGTGNDTPAFPAGQIPSHDYDLSGLNGNVYSFGDMLVTWHHLTPGALYDVWVFTGETGFVNQDVTISGGGAAIVYNESFSTNTLHINGQLGSSANTLDSYLTFGSLNFQQTADAAGEIRILLETNGNWSAIAGAAIREAGDLAIIPEPATVTLGLLSLGGLLLRRRRAA